MKNLFVPYKLAKLAKEKGFNEPCFTNFYGESFSESTIDHLDNANCNNKDYGNDDYLTAAPLYQQLVDWFREKHDIHIIISSATITKHCCGSILTRSKKSSLYDATWSNTDNDGTKPWDYYKALTHALTEAFKLIA